MTRKVMSEINEMFTPIQQREPIDDTDVINFAKNRVRKEYFNQVIHKYLKENHIWIEHFSKKDINILGKMYNDKDKEVLIQQVMYTLETRFGKPLKRIKDNNKSALFKEIDEDGWINTRTKEASWKSWEEWSVWTSSKDDWGVVWGDKESDNSTSWELLSS